MDPTAGLAPPTPARSLGPRGAPEQRWTCRVTPQGGRRLLLHFSGSLHPGWAGRIAAGLAARGVAVVRAAARRGPTRWTAEIEVETLGSGADPSAADFVALMREEPDPPRPGDLRIGSFRVAATRRDVEVEVRAADAVGFLGRILLVFAGLGLYPHVMRVETERGEIRDHFRLQGRSGQPPPAGIVAALERELAALASG